MSTYDLEEQEQLAALRAWWKQYSGIVTVVLIGILLTLSAWQGWNWYQRNQAGQAASIYEQLQKAVRVNDIKASRDATGSILEQYPRTIYAPLAALLSAKIHYQAGDLKTARVQLQWAVDHAPSIQFKSIARLRLANVLVDDQAPEEAAKLLEEKAIDEYEALFSIARGDILLSQKKLQEARTAYKSALNSPAKLDSSMRELVQLKLDALGES